MPIRALIYDQIKRLQKLKIEAFFFDKPLSDEEYDSFLDNWHKAKFLLLTPEKISINEWVRNLLFEMDQKGLINLFVVDEAHCI